MKVIKFIYENNKYKRVYNENILIIRILLEYSSLINKDLKELYFIYNGKKLSFENKEKISSLKNNNITIIIFNLNKKKENKKLNQIICPQCREITILNFD